MKILTLQIKKEFLDKILAGEKKEEFREITPKNAKKYIEYYTAEDGEEDIRPLEYDVIQFFNGYTKERPEAMVEVKDAIIEIMEDENGQEIVYVEDGKEYIMAQMVYTLGAIINKKNI